MLPSSPRPEPMDVDVDVINLELNPERTESKENLPFSDASTSTQISGPPSALSSKSPSRSTGVPPTRFYGASAREKGKQKADEPLFVPDSEEEDEGNDDEKQEKEVVAMLDVPPSQTTQVTNDK